MASKWIEKDGTRMKCHWEHEKCHEVVFTAGLCVKHYYQAKYKGNGTLLGGALPESRKCDFPECDQPGRVKGLCVSHREQQKKGLPLSPLNPRFPCRMRGCTGVYTTRSPYRLCKIHAQDARRYSLSGDELLRVWENAVCSNPGCRSTERLHVDHDHACCPPGKYANSNRNACGKCVRGLLCQSCNLAIGHVADDIERLRGLIEYLENAKPAAAI